LEVPKVPNADNRRQNDCVLYRHSGMPLAGIQPSHPAWIPANTVPE